MEEALPPGCMRRLLFVAVVGSERDAGVMFVWTELSLHPGQYDGRQVQVLSMV